MSEPWPDTDRLWSREEYRAWYDAQPRGRFERVDGEIVAMAPERVVHLRVKGAVFAALRAAVEAGRLDCEVFPDGATIETGDSDYEPDAVVACGPPMANDAIAIQNPVIIVEVLSPGTAATDTGAKLADYFRVPSVAHYLIVNPKRRMVTHHRRAGERIDTTILAGGPLVLDPPGVVVMTEAFFGAPTRE